MKLLNCLKAATLVAVAGLAACATPGSGPTVVSYDHGALDTLVALGQRPTGAGGTQGRITGLSRRGGRRPARCPVP